MKIIIFDPNFTEICFPYSGIGSKYGFIIYINNGPVQWRIYVARGWMS